jgi:UDP-N-acetylglucosamine 2-epimerase (non-hydrolysing)
MRFCTILGTRPEIVKMSPIIRECNRRGIDHFSIHTGQHYSYEMDRIFFEELDLPECRYNLNVGSGPHGQQTGKMMQLIEEVFVKDRPDIVLVQGDTNTVLAGALVAAKMGIPLGHVEAGLRSNDRTMPEEINRIVADHLSDILFPPTDMAADNLVKEGIMKDSIEMTGNTIVDAVKQNLGIAERKVRNKIDAMSLPEEGYILSTIHRQENVDSASTVSEILEGISGVSRSTGLPVLLPMHPRTRKNLERFNIVPEKGIKVIEPVGFLEFLLLEKKARLIMTDSGGLQEEACILGVPCVTLRNNTERPETVTVGANAIAGTTKEGIVRASEQMMRKTAGWVCPLGDGNASRKIIDHCLVFLGKSHNNETEI